MNKTNDIESGSVDIITERKVNDVAGDDEIERKTTCFGIIRNDFSSPFFSMMRVDGGTLDVKATIIPRSWWITMMSRLVFLIYSIISFIIDLKTTKFLWIWMGYLTNWAFIYALVYQVSILVCTFMPDSKFGQSERGEPNSLMIRFTWVLYELAASTQIAVTILYWVLLYGPGTKLDYSIFVTHGVIALLLLIDGNIIGRFPVRWKHFVVVELMSILYVIWSIIHSLLDIGKEERNNNLGQPLYDVLNWQDNPKGSTSMSLIVLFGLMPMLYLILWLFPLVPTVYQLVMERIRFEKQNSVIKITERV